MRVERFEETFCSKSVNSLSEQVGLCRLPHYAEWLVSLETITWFRMGGVT